MRSVKNRSCNFKLKNFLVRSSSISTISAIKIFDTSLGIHFLHAEVICWALSTRLISVSLSKHGRKKKFLHIIAVNEEIQFFRNITLDNPVEKILRRPATHFKFWVLSVQDL